MFRFVLLTFLFAAAEASSIRAEFESKLRSEVMVRKMRNLQLPDGFNLDEFQFNFAGYTFDANTAMSACPADWDATLSCILTDCPTVLDDCPDLTTGFEENLGAAPTAATPVEPETMPEMTTTPTEMPEMPVQLPATVAPTEPMMDMEEPEMEEEMDMEEPEMEEEMDMEDMATTNPSIAASGMRLLQGDPDLIPECAEIEEEFCAALSGVDTSTCCLTACTDQIQALLVCVIREQTGVDRSDCEIPECPTEAPATPAPAPTGETTSAAATTVSRVAALSASLLAFAVL